MIWVYWNMERKFEIKRKIFYRNIVVVVIFVNFYLNKINNKVYLKSVYVGRYFIS